MVALYLLPALAIYATLALWPLARLAGLSLQRWDGLTPAVFVGLDNYAALWSDPGVGPELWHTLLWLGCTLIVPVVCGLALALLLRAVPPRLRALARALLLLPLLLPTVVIAVIWRLVYNPLSGPLTGVLRALRLDALAGDWLGDPRLALPALLVPACWAAFGVSLLVCEAALGEISPAVLAAAWVDGAGPGARLRHILLPALRGALPLATVGAALCAVPSYDLIALLTNGGPGYATTTLVFDAYGRAFGAGQVGAGAALALLQSLIGLALGGAALLVARGQEPRDLGSETAGGWRPQVGGAALALGLLTALILAPLAWLIVLALRPAPGASLAGTLGDTLGVVWGQGFGAALLTSGGLALAVAAATSALALPAAFALATSRSRALAIGAAVALALGLFQQTAVLIIPLFGLLRDVGLLDTLPGVALPQIARALPLAILLLWMGVRGLPRDILEAAATDGAAPRQLLRWVVVPLTRPLTLVVAVWAFLSSWNDFLLPTVVLQDASLVTVPVALAHFIGRFDTEYAVLATGTLLAMAPLLALYAACFSVLARGLRGLRPGVGPRR